MKHNGDIENANEELILYRTGEESSEIAYKIWTQIHQEMSENMTLIANQSDNFSAQNNVNCTRARYLWADAISNDFYEKYAET